LVTHIFIVEIAPRSVSEKQARLERRRPAVDSQD
jgi:hypothetical protein